jgi:Kef-type K+ transport system membrane component KefB
MTPVLATAADPVGPVVLSLAVVLAAAKLGGHLASLFKQPAVLGELFAGMALGSLHLFGFTALEGLKTDAAVDLLARLGVLVLLFEVGLEATVGQMLKVGGSALLVAVLGVIAPFALGWGVSALLLAGHSVYVHAFVGAALSATSVGITARVLEDLKAAQRTEARIILGAAVIDDVLGLIVLAVVTGVIAAVDRGTTFSVLEVASISLKAISFLFGAIVLGVMFSRRLFTLASRLHGTGVLLATGLAFCFLLSWAAGAMGLAPIVGAFAAGLVLEETHFRDFDSRGEHGLEKLIHPISQFLVPVFFVQMGLRTDVRVFADPGVLLLAAALTAVAIVGKLACSGGVLERRLDRLSIGIGMIPRGEVGLIFAGIGLSLTVKGERIIDERLYAAIVVMVMVTTLVTPPALTWSLKRSARASPP